MKKNTSTLEELEKSLFTIPVKKITIKDWFVQSKKIATTKAKLIKMILAM